MLRVVDAEEPPLRVFFGAARSASPKADYESRLETWEQWDDVARARSGLTSGAHRTFVPRDAGAN